MQFDSSVIYLFSLFNYVIELTMMGHFSSSAKFREIPWKYQNSAKKGKFRRLAQNSATRKTVSPRDD